MDEKLYESIIDGESTDQSASVKESMFVASKTNPDTFAQEKSLSNQTGIPTDVVSRNKDIVQQKATSEIDYASVIDNSPYLGKYLSNPDNASAAHDDLDSLRKHEKDFREYNAMEWMFSNLTTGIARGESAIAKSPALLVDFALWPGNAMLWATGQSDKQVRSPEWLRKNPATDWLDAQAEAWKTPDIDKSAVEQMGRGDFAGASKTFLAQFIANMPQQAAILVSALAGNPMAGLGYAGVSAGSSANAIAQDSGVDPLSATGNAFSHLALETMLESAGTLGILKHWEGAIAKSFGKETSKQVMKEFGKTIAYSAFAEGNEEFLTSVGQDFSDYVTGVNPEALSGMLQRALDAGLIGGASGVSMTSPAALGSGIAKGREIRRAEQARNFYLSMGDTSEAAKLRAKLPEAHRQYVEGLVKNSPVEHVYIPVEAFDMYLQSVNENPASVANNLNIGPEYSDSVETGKPIKVPMGVWVSKVVGTPYYQGLANDIKFDQNGKTVNEHKAESDQIKADIEKEAADVQAVKQADAQAEAEKVKQEQTAQVQKTIEDKLKSTGKFADKDVKMLASLWSNFSRVFGGRTGSSPLDFFNQNPLNISTNENLNTQPGQSEMNQSDTYYKVNTDIGVREGRITGKTKDGRFVLVDKSGVEFLAFPGQVETKPKNDGGQQTLFQNNSPMFYSMLSKVVDEKVPNNASPTQILNTLKAAGVKQEEIDWMGLPEFLNGKEKISKAALQEFIKENEVQIEEKISSDKNTSRIAEEKAYEDRIAFENVLSDKFSGEDKKDWLNYDMGGKERLQKKYPEDINKYEELVKDHIDASEAARNNPITGVTKFSQYQLPGGENYREFLLTLKNRAGQFEGKWLTRNEFDELSQIQQELTQNHNFSSPEQKARFRVLKDKQLAYEKYSEAYDKKKGQDFYSSHFPGDPNIVVHVRANDRIDADGNKVLFIEEVQSDWHQKGRKQGYRGEDKTQDELAKSMFGKDNYDALNSVEQFKVDEAFDLNRLGVPDAPFKKTWHELAMKRMLRYAAENGYDKLSWTTGEQQAERYDLSKQVNEINWKVDNRENADGNKLVRLEPKSGALIRFSVDKDGMIGRDTTSSFAPPDMFIGKKLDEAIGKDLAEKILKDEEGALSDAGLKLGGEGMKGFYDQIIPSFMNKYAKKWGGKVGTTDINVSEGKLDIDDVAIVHSIDITPSMKESVLNGQALFQNGADPLGAIIFGKEGIIDIRLLKNMNYSTFLHETGHAFLEMLRRTAIHPDAPSDIQDMSEKTLKWLGIENWDQLERKHHEQFAQGFEKYLFEGKAPSEGLRKAFARFRVWLVSVYKTLQGINVELSNDIRGVMDRMLATDDEIALAEAEQGAVAMIQDPISILGAENGQRYLDAIEETKQESEAAMQLKLMEEYQRERKSWWMDELKKVMAEVAQEVNARPEQIALSILQRGKMPDGTEVPQSMKDLKIDSADFVRYYANKFDSEIDASDFNFLEQEFNVEQLEGTLRDIEDFRRAVGKVRRYDDGYLAEELAPMPRRYVTTNKFANTLDQAANEMGYESDFALLNKMVEYEEAYQQTITHLKDARKGLREARKQANEIKYKSIKIAMRGLPTGISAKEGISLSVVAQLFGYSSPEQFLDVISRTPKRNDLIKKMATDRMEELHGKLLGDKEAMHEQATQAIHNEKKALVLRMELEYLATNHTSVLKDLIRTMSARIPSSQFVKKYAADLIGRTTVNNISPYQFLLAERRFAKEAGKKLAQGRFDEAFEAKRKELLNYELYRASNAARTDVKNSLDQFKKIYRSDEKVAKGRDLDYVNAARAILAMHNIGSDGTDDPYQFVKNTQAYDPDTYETIKALIDAATENVGDYKTINYDSFVAMKEAVNAIWEISRRSRQIQINDKKMDLDEVRGHLIERIVEMTKKDNKSKYTKSATDNDKFVRAIMGAVSQGRRVESWADLMDGGDSKGWFTQAIWNPIIEGTQKFRIENKNYTQRFLELVKPIEKSLKQKEIKSDELRHIFQSKAELLGALLHTGNESNLSKLLRGRQWGSYLEDGTLDTSRWDTFISRMQKEGVLNKADYDFVQSVWDLFEDLKPASQKAHKEMYGFYFNSITTHEVVTPWGTYKGGYAPAIVDPFVSEDAAIRQEKNDADNTNNSYMFPTTGRGFSKARIERYAAPLALDLRLVPQHINKVLRFTYIEPRIKDVGRIVRNQEFREYLRDLDPTVGQVMLSPWLQRSALQMVEQPDKTWAGWSVWNKLRTASGVNIMAGNVINTLQQFTGLSIAAVKVKPSYLRNSMWSYIQNPKKHAEYVIENSDFMKTRSTTHIIEIQKNIEDIILNQNDYEKALDFAKKHAYFMQQGTQNVVDMIIWPGAYDQSVAQGNTHEQAVRDADAAVRLTQGDFSPENVSNLESGNAFARAFLMFYSYFNMQANLLGTEFGKVSNEMGLKKGAGKALYIYMFGFMIPAVVSEVILKSLAGDDWDKDDDGYLDDIISMFFGSQFRTATAMFPFVGQAINAGVNKFNKKWYDDDIKSSPAISMVESAVHSPYSVYKAIADNGNKRTAIKDTLSLIGLLTGAPVLPLYKPAGYMLEVSDGNIYPENALDFTRGLITGKSEKK